MQKYQCTADQFIKDTRHHSLEILRDDGVYRHLKFRNNGSMVYGFDLITWPGHLCITGDMGDYLFERLQDMFEFFREDKELGKLGINPGYWGEKLQAIADHGGYREFDEDAFRERVIEHFNEYWDEDGETEARAECWAEVEQDVLDHGGEHEACRNVYEFRFGYGGLEDNGRRILSRKYFQFDDFFDGGVPSRYTYHYLWCLFAIVWGISQYDEARAGKGNT